MRRRDVKLRYGSIVGVREESLLAYTQMHAAVWPGVLAALGEVNIRNYSIYLGQVRPGEYVLFSYFEYVGDDFEGDMKRMAADQVTQLWWSYTDPLQIRLPGTPGGRAVEGHRRGVPHRLTKDGLARCRARPPACCQVRRPHASARRARLLQNHQ